MKVLRDTLQRQEWSVSIVYPDELSVIRGGVGICRYFVHATKRFSFSKNLKWAMYTIPLGLSLIATAAFSSPFPDWRFYTSVDGLVESWVSTVTVGPSGRVFINHGAVPDMCIYDGYTFKTIPSPGTDLRVFEDCANRLWTIRQYPVSELLCFENGIWSVTPLHKIVQPEELREVITFRPDWNNKERLWFLSEDCLCEYDVATRRSRSVCDASLGRIGKYTGLANSYRGGVWVAGENGLGRLSRTDSGELDWSEYEIPAELEVSGLSRIREGMSGVVTAIADWGEYNRAALVEWDGTEWHVPIKLPNGQIDLGWRAYDDCIWASYTYELENHLVRFCDGIMEDIPRESVLAGEVTDHFVDEEGVVWIATQTGLARYSPSLWRTPHVGLGKSRPFHAMAEDERGRGWFVSRKTLACYADEKWSVIPVPGQWWLDSRCPLFQLPDGRLVVGTSHGKMLTYDPRSETFDTIRHPDGADIFLIHALNENTLAVSGLTRDGKHKIFQYTDNRFQDWLDITDHPELTVVSHILEMDNGDVWIGGMSDLAVLQHGVIDKIDARVGYQGNGVFCMLRRQNGDIWVGGRDAIWAFDRSGWHVVRKRNLGSVYGLMEDRDGGIWVASGTGIHHYFNDMWMDYTRSEGLPNTAAFAVRQDSKQRIWALTMSGVAYFDPATDFDPPHTTFNGFYNLKETPPNGAVRLRFGAFDRWNQTEVNRLLYSYRFDDGAWSPYQLSSRIFVTDLAKGPHRFEVRAMDRNWRVDPNPALFEFSVLPYWYEEPWFIGVSGVASVLILILSIGLVLRYRQLEIMVKRRTASLSEANETLTQEIAMRQQAEEERSSLESRLRQSQKMEMVGQLAGGIAHDFNNILQVILGYTEIALSSMPEDRPYYKDLIQVRTASERASGLTRQILSFSRRQAMEPIDLDCNQMIDGFVELLRRVIGSHIDIEFQAGKEVGVVHADPTMLEQVLINLCLNSRDAMPGGGKLTIATQSYAIGRNFCETHLWAKEGTYALLTVSDTGTGIPPENIERIFDPFFTTKGEGKGTGLGLAMVYGIVHQHGGLIHVYSEVGRGTTFKIYLPTVERTIQRVSEAKPEAVAGGQEVILLAEDEEVLRTLAVGVLERNGYSVLAAGDGEEALQLFERSADCIDLAILDNIMPKQNGRWVCERIRTVRPELPILFSSGGNPESADDGFVLEAGMHLIAKPYAMADLLKKVRVMLDHEG